MISSFFSSVSHHEETAVEVFLLSVWEHDFGFILFSGIIRFLWHFWRCNSLSDDSLNWTEDCDWLVSYSILTVSDDGNQHSNLILG